MNEERMSPARSEAEEVEMAPGARSRWSPWMKRLAVITGNLVVLTALYASGNMILDHSAQAQSQALFIPSDSLVYQGQLTSLSAQETANGLRVQANATETVALVKSSTQVLSGAKVSVDVPTFGYHADLTETSAGQYQTSAQFDVAINGSMDGQPQQWSAVKTWSVVPQSGAFTLGNASVTTSSMSSIKLTDALSKVNVLAQGLSGTQPVSGFIPDASIKAQSTGSPYQVPVTATFRAQVLDSGGNPLAGHQMSVTVAPNGLQAQTFNVATDKQGMFSYNVTYPATITVSGGQFANLSSPIQIQGTTAQEVSAFWWGGGDSSNASLNQILSNLGNLIDPNAQGGSDPVNIVTGNMYDVESDLSYPSPGIPIDFQRTYNSEDSSVGIFGKGWTQSYGLRIDQTHNGNTATLTEVTGDGRRVIWTQADQNGNFSPPVGVHGTLVVNGDKSYTKRDKHGVVSQYLNGDQGGMISSITDPDGNQVSFGYSGGQLTTVKDTAGRTLSLAYDGSGRATSLTDALGNTVGYSYNSNGQLATVGYPAGSTVSYAYDSNGNLAQITDPNGNHRLFTYDNQNRATSFSYDRSLEHTSFTYHPSQNKVILTDAQGFQTSYAYQYVGDSGVISKVVDPMGGVSTYQWDSNVNRTAATDALGHTVKMSYDGQGNLTGSTDAAGNASSVQYESTFNNPTQVTDALGKTAKMAYDGNGNLVWATDPLGNVTKLGRDPHGLLTQVADPAGNVTKLAYDGAGNLTGSTDALGNTAKATYDGLGHPTSAADALGRTSQLGYDGQYRLTKLTAADSSVITIGYDGTGNVASVTDQLGHKVSMGYDQANHPAKLVDALGRTTTMSYNVRGLLSGVRDAAGNTTSLTYNPGGGLSKLVRPDGAFVLQQHDLAGNVTAVTDPNGHTTKYGYDPRNLLTQVTDALGGVTRYGYDALGEQTSTTDANGHPSTVSYDADGRVTAKTDALNRTTKYSYNPVGTLATMVDALGQTTSYSYDSLARLVQVGYADGQTTKWSYDAAGNRTQMTDGLGTANYAYDSLNRLVKEVLQDGTGLAYAYDAVGNRTVVTTPVGTTSYSYDAANQMSQVTDPGGGVTKLGYDNLGRVVKQANPNGTSATRAYDAVGQLTRETYSGPQGVQNDLQYVYDRLGNRVGVTENGKQTVLAMDALNRLTQVGYPGGPQVKYTYDGAGNRTSQTISGLPTNNASDEPRDEPANGTTSYTYDAADELLSAGSQKFSYDADGHLTSMSGGPTGNVTYAWDARQLLTSVTTPDHQVSYGYDGYGRLVSRQDKGGKALQNVYDGSLLLLQKRYTQGDDQSKAPWTEYVSGNGQVLSTLRTNPAGQIVQQQYLQNDALGSLVGITNQQGALTSSFAYTAWGSPLGNNRAADRGEGNNDNQGDGNQDGGDPQGNGDSQGISDNSGSFRDFSYIGQPFDFTSGLGYFNARWYQPQTGRFISQDRFPAMPGAPGTINRYAYALNNPSTFEDPTGLTVMAVINGVSEAAFVLSFALAGAEIGAWMGGIFGGLLGGIGGGALCLETVVGTPFCAAGGAAAGAAAGAEAGAVIGFILGAIIGLLIWQQLVLMMASRGTPGNNKAQNKSFRGAVQEINSQRQLRGKSPLTRDQMRQLHNAISGQNYGFWDIVNEGLAMFDP